MIPAIGVVPATKQFDWEPSDHENENQELSGASSARVRPDGLVDSEWSQRGHGGPAGIRRSGYALYSSGRILLGFDHFSAVQSPIGMRFNLCGVLAQAEEKFAARSRGAAVAAKGEQSPGSSPEGCGARPLGACSTTRVCAARRPEARAATRLRCFWTASAWGWGGARNPWRPTRDTPTSHPCAP